MLMCRTLGSAMKRDNHYVRFAFRLAYRGDRILKVQQVVSEWIGCKSDQLHFLALHRHPGNVPDLSGMQNPQRIQHGARTCPACETEIECVVVRQSHYRKPRRFQVHPVSSRNSEGIASANLLAALL